MPDILSTGMGIILGGWNDQRQRRQQEALNDIEMQKQREMTDYNMKKQLEMWEKTGYGAQVAQMEKAGLNVGLMYGMGGGGAGTTNVDTGNVTGGSAPVGGGELGMAMQLSLLKAQKENIEADTANKRADTTGKGITQAGQLTDNEIKVIDRAIRLIQQNKEEIDFEDYYEAEFELDDEGNKVYTHNNEVRKARKAEAKASFEQKKAQAELYMKLWQDGTLQKMTQAELDNKLKEIGVKEQAIDKAKLENILTEMDVKLAEKLGLGKDSKGWIDSGAKILLSILMKFIRQR